jgi:hypothetical protein
VTKLKLMSGTNDEEAKNFGLSSVRYIFCGGNTTHALVLHKLLTHLSLIVFLGPCLLSNLRIPLLCFGSSL